MVLPSRFPAAETLPAENRACVYPTAVNTSTPGAGLALTSTSMPLLTAPPTLEM